jgi:hypothetical protein
MDAARPRYGGTLELANEVSQSDPAIKLDSTTVVSRT